jgi:hypothetical protein
MFLREVSRASYEQVFVNVALHGEPVKKKLSIPSFEPYPAKSPSRSW